MYPTYVSRSYYAFQRTLLYANTLLHTGSIPPTFFRSLRMCTDLYLAASYFLTPEMSGCMYGIVRLGDVGVDHSPNTPALCFVTDPGRPLAIYSLLAAGPCRDKILKNS